MSQKETLKYVGLEHMLPMLTMLFYMKALNMS